MRTKKLFAILLVALALGYRCNDSTVKKDHTESAVPPELQDTAATNADDEHALEQLKNVVK